MTWHEKVRWLYDHVYEGNGGFQRLASDLGVKTRLTVQRWYHWPGKLNPCSGKPVEPSYWHRISIDVLYEEKTKQPEEVTD